MNNKYVTVWLVKETSKYGIDYTVHVTRKAAEEKFLQMAKDYGELLDDEEILVNDEDDMGELAAGGVYNAPDGSSVEIIKASINTGEFSNTDRMRELQHLKKFAAEGDFSNDVERDKFLCLWTAYCLHFNLDVGTKPYEDALMEIWFSMGESEEERAIGWGGLGRFADFAAKFLV